MTLAGVAVIRADARVVAKYKNIIVMMDGDKAQEPRAGDLYLTAIPVTQEDLPSNSANIFAALAIEPVLFAERTNRDSSLEALSELHEFRKLLYSQLPLVDGNPTPKTVAIDQSKILSDDTVNLRLASMGTMIKNFRIPKYVARWQDKIDPETGERVG
jgi:hypothetical protein